MNELELALLKWQDKKNEQDTVKSFFHLEDREEGYWIVSSQYEKFLGCDVEVAKVEISLFFNFGFHRDLSHLKSRIPIEQKDMVKYGKLVGR